ncbi:MAG TPA: hypothetical protein VMM58_05305 [Bacteroidota bacterium]|nr:hypothetical protein [Bacteroidota bacterium]
MKFFHPGTVSKVKPFAFLLLLLTATISFQCIKAPLEPKAPSFNVPLNIGLIDRTFTFGQMVSKDSKFITDSSTSNVYYQPSSLVNDPTPIELPELTPEPTTISQKLGVVPLSVPSIPDVNVTFQDIFGVDPGSGITYLGPDATAPLNNNINNPTATYDYLVFDDGQMSLTITNNFPFAVSFQNGVQLSNSDLGLAVVANFGFTTISAHSQVTKQAVVSGKLMSANLKMQSTITTSGASGQTITNSQNLVSHLAISGTTGPTATLKSAKVELATTYPVYNQPDSAVQLVDDSTKIKRAEFSDGSFQIKIANGIATSIAVDFEVPEFVNRISGAPFVLTDDATGDTSGIIQPNSVFIQTVHMKNYAIQSQLDTIIGGRPDTLSDANVHFKISIKTLGVTNGKVVISKDDSVRVDITPLLNNQSPPRKTYVLTKVIGKVRPTPVPINETVDAAIGDIGNKFTADSIKFDSVSITLKILSTGSFPTDLSMKIYGVDKKGAIGDSLTARERNSSGVLTDTLRIDPGVTKEIVFDKSTSQAGNGIDQFLSSFFAGGSGSLPQKLIVKGQAIVDPVSYYKYPDSTGTVKAGDSVFTSVQFLFPVRIGIINGTYRDTIVISDTSGNKIDKKNLTSIDSGKVTFIISNAFPFQLDVSSKLLPGLATDRSKPDTTALLLLPKVGTIRADSARYVSKPTAPLGLTGTVIGLTTDDILQVNPADFVAINIRLNTSGSNQPVVFKDDYYVELKAFLSVQYNVNFDKK